MSIGVIGARRARASYKSSPVAPAVRANDSEGAAGADEGAEEQTLLLQLLEESVRETRELRRAVSELQGKVDHMDEERRRSSDSVRRKRSPCRGVVADDCRWDDDPAECEQLRRVRQMRRLVARGARISACRDRSDLELVHPATLLASPTLVCEVSPPACTPRWRGAPPHCD